MDFLQKAFKIAFIYILFAIESNYAQGIEGQGHGIGKVESLGGEMQTDEKEDYYFHCTFVRQKYQKRGGSDSPAPLNVHCVGLLR